MNNLKSEIKNIFCNKVDLLDISLLNSKDILELKLNTIIENIINDIEDDQMVSVPLAKTTNDNIYIDSFNLESGKSDDVDLSNNYDSYKPKQSITNNIVSTIPLNLTLNYEMRQFAKSKFITDPEDVFSNFKLYYQSKGILNSDWDAVWKRWVLKQNQFKTHLIKTVIDEDMLLNKNMRKVATKYINKDNVDLEFLKFKNHYMASGDIKVSWEKMWENWSIKYKEFKPVHNSKTQEKQNYRWDFRKAKEVSDRIKDWLEFEKNINWLDDFYWKDIPIPGIGWQKVLHPDFNKEEILLYKIDSVDGNFMLDHKTDDIIDAEVLESD